MVIASPLIALALTVLFGALLFVALGKDPARGLAMFFWEPIRSGYAWSEIAMKAVPLVLIALGLSLCYRANVWNIGAEGQYILGAVCAGGIAIQAGADTSRAIVVVVLVAGVIGGMAWAALVALLRDRFNANEILVSLMLVYVAEMLLGYLVYGPWKDPAGFNFPQSITFPASTQVPRLVQGWRVNVGVFVALAAVVAMALFLFRSLRGFQAQVSGLAPAAATYAGFSARANLWTVLLVVGRARGPGGCARSCRPDRAAHAVRARGLRLRGDHRRLRRAAASGGRGVRGGADEHVRHRRRTRAVTHATAQVGDGRLPGPAAVLPAGVRHLHPPAAAARAARGDFGMNELALLLGSTLAAGTVLAIAALGL